MADDGMNILLYTAADLIEAANCLMFCQTDCGFREKATQVTVVLCRTPRRSNAVIYCAQNIANILLVEVVDHNLEDS